MNNKDNILSIFGLSTLILSLLLPEDALAAKCADAYFIGVHGVEEGPDLNGVCPLKGPTKCSPTIEETWKAFKKLAWQKGKKHVTRHYLRYPSPEKDAWGGVPGFQGAILGARIRGVWELDKFVRETVLKECPKIKTRRLSLWVIHLARGSLMTGSLAKPS